jgi:rhodanese-related sulfurtransferase
MTGKTQTTISLALLIALSVTGMTLCGCGTKEAQPVHPDRFETIRSFISAWLAGAGADLPVKPAGFVKETILDNWESKKDTWQIVSVRTKADYDSTGHIANAIHAPWRLLAEAGAAGLDPGKKILMYCCTGHTAQIGVTVLGLLGHEGYNMKFGMMDWNLGALATEPWDMVSGYAVETGINLPDKTYPFPEVRSEHADPVEAIRDAAGKYLSDADVALESARVKEILDDWESYQFQYQIVSVRKAEDYESGHIPHAINIHWKELADSTNLAKLDPNKTTIVYCYVGPTGQIASTVLNILGYNAINLQYGMMDWNADHVSEEKKWDGLAVYPVELADYLK